MPILNGLASYAEQELALLEAVQSALRDESGRRADEGAYPDASLSQTRDINP